MQGPRSAEGQIVREAAGFDIKYRDPDVESSRQDAASAPSEGPDEDALDEPAQG